MRARLVLAVARRYARSVSLARSTVLAGAVSALLVGLFVTLSAFTLSGDQLADRDVGRYGSVLNLTLVRDSYTLDLDGLGSVGNPPPGDTRAVEAYAAAVRRAGADEVAMVLESFDVGPARVDAPFAFYVETDWTVAPFPGYTLTTGRWPARPGEVVLTEGLRREAAPGAVLPVLSGNERLRVVGVAHDRFGDSSEILAAAGTWGSLGAATQRRFPHLGAMATLHWNGGDRRAVTAAVAAAIQRKYPGTPRGDLATAIDRAVQTRAAYVARERRTWVDKIPLAYDLPSLGLPLLSVLAVFGLNTRRFRRSLGVLVSVGLRRRDAVTALALATTGWLMAATAAGALAGAGLGAAGRAVADRILAAPISPYPRLAAPVGRLLGVTAVACLVAAAALHLATRPTRGAPRTRRRLPAATPIRRALGVVAGCAVVLQARRLDDVPAAMVLAGTVAGAVLLFTPELVGATLRLLPVAEPRVRLGRRQLAADPDRAVGAVVVLAAALGAPLALLTLLATLISTVAADLVPAVAPGQLVLAGTGGDTQAPPREVVDAVTGHVGFGAPAIRLGTLNTDDSRVGIVGSDNGLVRVLAVDSVAEAARLNNAPLTGARAETLRRGGMLVQDSGGPARRALVRFAVPSERVLATTAPIPAVNADFEPAWLAPGHALLLTGTARRLGMPVHHGGLVYTGVSDAQAVAATQALLDAGLDPQHVSVHVPPEPFPVPPAYQASVLGLGLLVLLTTLAVARAQVVTLRGYLGRLVAVGLTTRWVRQVLLVQGGVIVGVSTVVALLIAIPPVVVATWQLPDLVLTIPWTWLGLTVTAFYAATAGGILLSSRRLRARDAVPGAV